MEPSCVRQNLLPGVTRLFEDYLYNFDRVSGFYGHNFADRSSFREAIRELHFPDARRKKLVEALRKQNGDSPALDELSRPGTVAIVTGQQVGLLSGPSYTIFKALTAVKLAATLRAEGIQAVPIFWLASEDHDLAEVDHAWLFNENADPRRITIADTVTNGGPVGDVELNDLPYAEIREALGQLPFADEVCARLKNAYYPGATLGNAFKTFLQDVLKECGLLYLDPLAPPIRELARPFLADVAGQVPELLAGLRARDRQLLASGYHTQVHLDEGTSLLFLLSDGKRMPLRWEDGQFTLRDKSYTTEDLSKMAERLSPNALLRPVMQDYLLPTICYVGGPAEIAYMAQGNVLYQRLLGRMPVIFPRNSFTLLDNRAEKLLERYQLQMPDLLDYHEKVKGRMAARLVPATLAEEFSSLETSLAESLQKLQANLQRFDPSLEGAAKKSTAKMLYQLRRLSGKTARETLRRDERSARDAKYLIDLVYPHRRLQERFYSIVPFLAKYGMELPASLLEITQLSCPDHMVRTI